MNVFIGCVKEKKSGRCKAKDLYDSPLFRYSWAYAQTLNDPHIYILSAKHYLLNPETEIDPYNQYLGDFSAEKRKEWAEEVVKQMKAAHINFNEKTYFLAGSDYTEFLMEYFPNCIDVYSKPHNHGLGYILKYLKSKCSINEQFIGLRDYIINALAK